MANEDTIIPGEQVEEQPGVLEPGKGESQTAESHETVAEETVQEELCDSGQPDSGDQEHSEGDTELDNTAEATGASPEGDQPESAIVSVTGPIEELNADTMEAEMRAVATRLLEDNPGKEAVHFTEDLIPFFDKRDAYRYSSRLDNHNVITITRN